MDEQAQTAQTGLEAWRRGDAVAARQAWEAVAAAGRASPQLWLLLAQARDVTGAGGGLVDQALDQVLAAAPQHIPALVMKGDRARDDDRAACSYYAMALGHATEDDRKNPALARLLQQAEVRYQAASARFVDHLRSKVGETDAGPRFEEAVALVTGEKQLYLQQPNSFFFPGLPHRQFFPMEEFDWAPALVAEFESIRDELIALQVSGTTAQPYVQADPARASHGHLLMDSANWSAFHLIDNGVPTDHARRCSRTMAALASVPMPLIEGRSPMALFSVLRAGTHIPPHHGLLNTRLICHLPIIVPDHCRLRVGNETKSVHAGELMIFDDSIEHEAWNDSDDTRVVLLFEIWRPELTAAERGALTQLFESIQIYAGGQ